ncbi:MAG: hypothetical protein MI866_11100, partial [Bacteroidales bacterium]|nr:hypothetical protein [Bacteroidales bacterium]
LFIKDNAAVLVAFMSFVVSGIALYHSIKSSKRDQRHKELSVRPLLSESAVIEHDGTFVFKLRNNGVGPAIITNFKYYWLNEEFDSGLKYWDAVSFFIKGQIGTHFDNVITSTIQEKTIIKDGGEITLVRGKIIADSKHSLTKVSSLLRDGFTVKVVFEDLYKNEEVYNSFPLE